MLVWFGGYVCVTVTNFVPIDQTVTEIWPYIDFVRWRPSAILDFSKFEILTTVRFEGVNICQRRGQVTRTSQQQLHLWNE